MYLACQGNKLLSSIVILSLSIVLGACGGGSGGSGSSPDQNSSMADNNNSEVSDGNTTVDVDDNLLGQDLPNTGQFDLAEYFFENILDRVGASVMFPVNTFRQDTGERLFMGTESTITRVVDENGSILETQTIAIGTLEPDTTTLFRYNIGNDAIEVISFEDEVANPPFLTQRFVNVGDVFQDVTATVFFDDMPGSISEDEGGLTVNTRCTVVEQLDEFNLAEATGPFNLASGVFSDVLRVNCQMSIVLTEEELNQIPDDVEFNPVISDADTYFAREVGEILTEASGLAAFLLDIYLIRER